MNISEDDIRSIKIKKPFNFRHEAKKDIYRVFQLLPRFVEASKHCGIPTVLLCAIASRESNIGKSLDIYGYGDGGDAFGIMQIDERHHSLQSEKPFSADHIFQSGHILMGFIDDVWSKHHWPKEWSIRGGIAAYNFGVKNVLTQSNLDIGTSRNNYSEDVVSRAQLYCDFL